MNKIIDIHTHSSLQPNAYLRSFENSNQFNTKERASIWFKDSYNNLWEKLIQKTFRVSQFSQSDFTTIKDGEYEIVFVSLYPVERGFAEITKKGLTFPFRWLLKRFAGKIASTFKNRRLAYIGNDSRYNYYSELISEYNDYFGPTSIVKYSANNRYSVLKPNMATTNDGKLKVVITVEGAHVFCNGTNTNNAALWDGLESRILSVKQWDSPPFFITLAHHYYNGLCTHAKSIFILEGNANQKDGMRDYGWSPIDNYPSITDTGYRVIRSLLRKSISERRVLIDVKHMSIEARREYYNLLRNEFTNESIPIIFSHGAYELFYKHEINFNNEDLEQVYLSKGIIGLELDKRVLGVKDQNESFYKLKQHYSELGYSDDVLGVWLQVISVAEWAYNNNFQNALWDIMCLGSDYDGVITAIKDALTAEHIPMLFVKLQSCLEFYWDNNLGPIPRGNSENIIDKIRFQNAFDFLQKHYIRNTLTPNTIV